MLVDGQGVFLIVPADVGIGEREGVAPAAEQAVAALREAIAVGRESRDLRVILLATGLSALAALLYAAIVRGLFVVRRRIGKRLLPRVEERASQLKGVAAFGVQHVMLLTRRAVDVVAGVLILFATYVFMAFVLERFPYSRPWGDALGSNLVDLAMRIGLAIVGALPGLVTVVVIFVLARSAVQLAGAFFDRVARVRRPSARSTPTPSCLRAESPASSSGCSRSRWLTHTCPARTPTHSRACRCSSD